MSVSRFVLDDPDAIVIDDEPSLNESYRQKLVELTKPRSEYPGGRYPSEGDAPEKKISGADAAKKIVVSPAVKRAGLEPSKQKLQTIAETATALGFPTENIQIVAPSVMKLAVGNDEKRVAPIGLYTVEGGTVEKSDEIVRNELWPPPGAGTIRLDAKWLAGTTHGEVAWVVAHEVTHDAFHKATWWSHNQDVSRLPDVLAPGEKPPNVAKFLKYVDDHAAQLEKEDGFTPYSRQWWAEATKRNDQPTKDQALNETLADISARKEIVAVGRMRVSATWREAHNLLMKSYKDPHGLDGD